MELCEQIKRELEVHTQLENEIFYPAFKQAGTTAEDDQLFYEAVEEHRTVGYLVLPDLADTPAESYEFAGRAAVLKELVEHHIKEEEGEMFKRAKKLLDKHQREALGARMRQRKDELLHTIA